MIPGTHHRLATLCRKLGLVSAAAAHSEKINDVLIDPEDLERSVQTLRSCERVQSLMFNLIGLV